MPRILDPELLGQATLGCHFEAMGRDGFEAFGGVTAPTGMCRCRNPAPRPHCALFAAPSDPGRGLADPVSTRGAGAGMCGRVMLP